MRLSHSDVQSSIPPRVPQHLIEHQSLLGVFLYASLHAAANAAHIHLKYEARQANRAELLLVLLLLLFLLLILASASCAAYIAAACTIAASVAAAYTGGSSGARIIAEAVALAATAATHPLALKLLLFLQ